MINEAKLQKLIDRQEILDCLTRYSRGVDRLDRDILTSAYHPDALDDHGIFVGNREEFADVFFHAHTTAQKKTMHILGNHTCEIDGNIAHAETYCTFYGYNKDDTVDIVLNRYVDRLEKRDGEWGIADRICVVEFFGRLKSGEEADKSIREAAPALMSNASTNRDKTDVSYNRPLKVVRSRRMPG